MSPTATTTRAPKRIVIAAVATLSLALCAPFTAAAATPHVSWSDAHHAPHAHWVDSKAPAAHWVDGKTPAAHWVDGARKHGLHVSTPRS
jgi:hypothetical protein